ncbi:MAG: protease modulator HflC [Clostridia bacterium]|nr:protease modulator HflC [Clostridia bacterium]
MKAEKISSRGLSRILRILLAAAVIILLLWFGFTFRVKEGNCAIVLRFGAPRVSTSEAGLHLRLPWPFEKVVSYDRRLQYFETNSLETITKDKRNIIIQPYVVWRIEDPLLFHNSVGSSGSVATCLRDQVFSATNSTMGTYTLSNLVSLESESVKTGEIQDTITAEVRQKCLSNYGIEIISVRILRLSLPDTNLQSVFDQMTAERQKDIDTILANAERDASKIRTDADAEAASIIAEGTIEASKIRAEAEAAVAGIYAKAEAANLELYTFLRQLDTLAASVGESTVLIVDTSTYPFSILKGYSDLLSSGDETAPANEGTVISDLTYILSKLPKEDADALTAAVAELISNASKTAQ